MLLVGSADGFYMILRNERFERLCTVRGDLTRALANLALLWTHLHKVLPQMYQCLTAVLT